ncbi:hypothetical protein JVU11DRAFT_2930 [Chiua virens]|nr:hypothetical protein JVU11DRAFT_2930 [Chiua virens]
MGSYEPGTSIKDDLGDLLLRVGQEFKKESPHASSLNWTNVSICAHESMSKHSNIDEDAMDGTAQAFLDLFVKRGWGTQVNLKGKLIEVQFVYRHEEIVSMNNMGLNWDPRSQILIIQYPDSNTNYAGESVAASNFLPSRRPKPKRKALVVNSDGELDKLDLRLVHKPKQPPILFSAFRPPKLNARNPPLVSHGFTRTTAVYQESGTVSFLVSDKEEDIEIAGDWEVGQHANKEDKPFWNTGYIGEGYTKTAVYAQFKGKDYVLTQLTQREFEYPHTEDENEAHLKVEYEHLCQGDGIKVYFDKYVKEAQYIVADFYFNFKGSILGVLHSRRESTSWILPYQHFIAMRLLPCGEIDGPLRKFTGNSKIGKATDDLTKAVHAFAHFMLIYMSGFLLLSNLQGLFDAQHVMCFKHEGKPKLYWDGGKTAITHFASSISPKVKVTEPDSESVVPTKPPLHHDMIQIDHWHQPQANQVVA